jgi:hypothetical protein
MFVSCECCQVEVSARGRSLVQGSSSECGLSECDLETSKWRRPRPHLDCCATGKEKMPLEIISIARLIRLHVNGGSLWKPPMSLQLTKWPL